MISRNGVCYDLRVSSHRVTIDGLTFVFSSKLHRDKFKAKIEDHRKTINRSLSNRFNLNIDVPRLADIVLYKKIESRGFLIVTDEGINLCHENLKYVGGKVTQRNFNAL